MLFSVALLLAGGAATVRGQSPLDGFDPNANGLVFAVVVQPADGKILIGGGFTTLSPNGGPAVACNYLARLNPDGTLDTTFNHGLPGQLAGVSSIAVQPDGNILIGGDFQTVEGRTRRHIARLYPNGALDIPFDPDADGTVHSIALLGNGKILIGGDFTHIGTTERNYIARVDGSGPNSGRADAFDPNADQPVRAIVLTPGQVLVGGFFTTLAPNGGMREPHNRIARLRGTGTADPTFHPNPDGVAVYAIAVQADGKILMGGDFTHIGATPRNYIARLEISGTLDANFNPSAEDIVGSIVVQADGKILVGGNFREIGGMARNHLARLYATGATAGLADDFDPNAVAHVYAIAVQRDGKILAGGEFYRMGGKTRNQIARLEIDGRLDQTLNPRIFSGPVYATAIQPDGKILVGGAFYQVLGEAHNNIARFNPDGTLDEDFHSSVNGVPRRSSAVVYAIAVQKNGQILVGGSFAYIGAEPRSNIALLERNGAVAGFAPEANGAVYAIAVQADDKILVGGVFTRIGGADRNRIARLETNGSADGFNPDADDAVYSIVVQTKDAILVGGAFMTLHTPDGNPLTRKRIARLDTTGAINAMFNPNASDSVYAIAVQADGKVLVGGAFTEIGSRACSYIARLDATTGTADPPEVFEGNADYLVHSIAVQADGKILLGGEFNTIGIGIGQSRIYIARLKTNGSPDSFDAHASGGYGVFSIALQADGKILAGGNFTAIGDSARDAFARLSNDTAALQNLALTPSSIFSQDRRNVTWTRGGSSPQFTRVTFEYSTNNVDYMPLGNGRAIGSNWTLAGASLPAGQNFYIRARGYYRSGQYNGSESITESVRNDFIKLITAFGG